MPGRLETDQALGITATPLAAYTARRPRAGEPAGMNPYGPRAVNEAAARLGWCAVTSDRRSSGFPSANADVGEGVWCGKGSRTAGCRCAMAPNRAGRTPGERTRAAAGVGLVRRLVLVALVIGVAAMHTSVGPLEPGRAGSAMPLAPATAASMSSSMSAPPLAPYLPTAAKAVGVERASVPTVTARPTPDAAGFGSADDSGAAPCACCPHTGHQASICLAVLAGGLPIPLPWRPRSTADIAARAMLADLAAYHIAVPSPPSAPSLAELSLLRV